MNKNKTYSNFKYEDLKELGINFRSKLLFENVKEVEPSDWLKQTLSKNAKIPKITEKAKSEMIISPILTELFDRNPNTFNFYSGYNFDVDKEKGLKGRCDFLLSTQFDSPIIEAPIFSVVEAKRDDFENGIPQCAAEMYASKIYNERENHPLDFIYGTVTIGNSWLFLKLEGTTVYQDIREYGINELPKLLGVLQTIIDFYKK